MGGNAFPLPARRLTSAQLAALRDHAQAALEPFFERTEALRDAGVKADHGDLDLICGWAHERAWNWKGEERGVMDGGQGMGGPIKLANEAEVRAAAINATVDDAEQKETAELQVWCFVIAHALKAKEWIRRGPEISLAIPCSVFGEVAQEHQADEAAFYQLDLPLIPPGSLDFYVLTVSYSTTFLILARAIRCISPSLTLQMVGLIIRHAAYPGIPGIDLRLTSDVDELCDYLGLSREIWARGFETEQECWTWLATVRPGGKLEEAYKRMVRPRAVRQKGHKGKAGGLDAFVAYLRTTRHGEGWDTDLVRAETPLPLLAADTAETQAVPPLTPSSATTTSTSPLLTPGSASASLVQAAANMLDPENPVPLDARAQDALDRWDKREAYEAILKKRKTEVTFLAERQQKRIQGRQRAEELLRRKEMNEVQVGQATNGLDRIVLGDC